MDDSSFDKVVSVFTQANSSSAYLTDNFDSFTHDFDDNNNSIEIFTDLEPTIPAQLLCLCCG